MDDEELAAQLAQEALAARLAEEALQARGQATPRDASGQEYFYNPQTGQYTNRELLANAYSGAGAASAAGRGALQGATLGFGDEMAGGVGRMIGGPERERLEIEQARAQNEAARADNPVAYAAGEIGGAVALPAMGAGGAATTGGALARGALAGGAAGALYGMGTVEGGFDDQGIRNRAGGALAGAGMGAIGGAAAVPVGAVVRWAGATLGPKAAQVFGDNRYYTPQGGLTQAGRQALQTIGYDMAAVSERFAREFGERANRAASPEEAAAAAELAEFGIPAYPHNIDRSDVTKEAEFHSLAAGTGGAAAGRVVSEARNQQNAAVRNAAERLATSKTGGAAYDQGDAGAAIRERLQGIAEQDRAAAQAAYEAARRAGVTIPGQVAGGVATRIRNKLAADEFEVDQMTTPTAWRILSALERRGQAPEGQAPSAVSLERADSMRKRINQAINSARGEDLVAMTAIKREYDQWLNDIVESKLFDGDGRGFEDLKRARELWSNYARRFMGDDKASKFMQDMIDADASEEQVVNWLFGSSRLGRGKMTSDLAAALKTELGADSTEWNMLRQAALRQLVYKPGAFDNEGNPVAKGVQALRNDILNFINNPATKPLARQLYSDEELAELRRFAGAVDRLVPRRDAVNPSGTSYENQRAIGRMFNMLSGMIGGASGGPVGAAAAAQTASAAQGARGWLKAYSATQQGTPRRTVNPATQPAAGAVGVQGLLDSSEDR